MEKHIEIENCDQFNPNGVSDIFDYFLKGRLFVNKYYSEVEREIRSKDFTKLDPDTFFKEYIWVVHASGFSAKAVSKFIPKLFNVYTSMENTASSSFKEIYERINPICANEHKSKAIHKTATLIHNSIKDIGWQNTKQKYLSRTDLLSDLPYIGNVTKYHLARNIGHIHEVKPDLHLNRLSSHFGYTSPLEMCKYLQKEVLNKTGENIPLGIVDLTLWYAASTFGTINLTERV